MIADPGISGARSPKDRPGFARILTLAEARAFSVLLGWKFDRLARSLLCVYPVCRNNYVVARDQPERSRQDCGVRWPAVGEVSRLA
mgnify:CR=1 FL=1